MRNTILDVKLLKRSPFFYASKMSANEINSRVDRWINHTTLISDVNYALREGRMHQILYPENISKNRVTVYRKSFLLQFIVFPFYRLWLYMRGFPTNAHSWWVNESRKTFFGVSLLYLSKQIPENNNTWHGSKSNRLWWKYGGVTVVNSRNRILERWRNSKC